jgi:hypothetical protein
MILFAREVLSLASVASFVCMVCVAVHFVG